MKSNTPAIVPTMIDSLFIYFKSLKEATPITRLAIVNLKVIIKDVGMFDFIAYSVAIKPLPQIIATANSKKVDSLDLFIFIISIISLKKAKV